MAAETRAVLRELRSVRRPRDVRRLLHDPAALSRVADPLGPGLDRIASLVSQGTLPLTGRPTTVAVTATGAIGAVVSSGLEVLTVLGVAAPPTALASAGGAAAAAVGAELVEFYLIASEAVTLLRAAGIDDPSALRRVMFEAYLGEGGGENTTAGGVERVAFQRVARALVRRAVPRLAPVAGIPVAGWSSWRDLSRARAAVHRTIAAAPPMTSPPT